MIYVCECINKGLDMATYRLQPQIDDSVNLHEVQLDEVSQYQNRRYISSHVLRILGFPIYERHLAIVQLTVYLENEQSIYYLSKQLKFFSKHLNTPLSQNFFIIVQMILWQKQFFTIRHPRIALGTNHL